MKIFVWGTGSAALDLLDEELNTTEVEAFIDNAHKIEWKSKPVYEPSAMKNKDYDAIIVATSHASEIYSQAKELNLDLSKFVFINNNLQFYDLNSDYTLASKIFRNSFIDTIKNRQHVISRMRLDEISPPSGTYDRKSDMYEVDYNRIRTFELISQEILGGGVRGSVAELGVFQGKFAKYINGTFSDRTCYLFDTFESFRESEALKEKEAGHCGDSFVERFKDTSEEAVLSIMPYPDMVICRKGLFPESLDGLEDKFAFVSLDVDFEQSIYDGLTYFYPRLSTGGYIMVHDYNSKKLKGVRNAIKKYEQKLGITLAKVPIPDVEGTLVISK